MADNLYWKDKGGYFRTYIENTYYAENSFLHQTVTPEPLPGYEAVKPLLPVPVWEGHEDAVRCYFRAWEIAFKNLKQPEEGSGFIANYIDPAFNGNVFMWDSVFMLMFGHYGSRAFDFQRTLDNFYAKQHRDGFICREINEATGDEQFHRYDPSSTGPNLLAWSEWCHYEFTGNRERLQRIFPVIAGYHRWMRNFRTWQDGSYYASGWGCGMDNQPRIREDYQFEFFHGFMSWIDTTLQQLLSARLLVKMAEVLGRPEDGGEFAAEAGKLAHLVNDRMWDDSVAFYFDKYAEGSLSKVMSVGSFWALLAGAVPPERLKRFIAHLEDPASFKRPHRVPTLAANDPHYNPAGGYWCGSVWAPTNYMVLKGLEHVGEYGLAAEIARNHFDNVLNVFLKDGTLYENYAPDFCAKGSLAANEFVGWTGISVINVLFEFVFGIKPDIPNHTIVWDVRLLDRHGICNYPLGNLGTADLICEERGNAAEEPVIRVKSTVPLKVRVLWEHNEKTIEVREWEECI